MKMGSPFHVNDMFKEKLAVTFLRIPLKNTAMKCKNNTEIKPQKMHLTKFISFVSTQRNDSLYFASK